MVSDRMAVSHRPWILKQKSVLNNRLVKNSLVCMFSPLLYQDHLRVFLVSTSPCPWAKDSRSFFLVTITSSYSMMMKNKSLKQMSRLVKIFWARRYSAEADIRGHHELPGSISMSTLVALARCPGTILTGHWCEITFFPSACITICSQALTSTWVSWRFRVPQPRDTPYNGPYGKAPPLRGTFFRLQVYKRVGIVQVEVY